jgi:hypothetical protein
MNFQEKIFHDTTYLRIKYPLSAYPSYHTGLYLEEYFCDFFIKNCLNEERERYYLPIFWTNIYLKNWVHGYRNPVIQCYLNTIPKDKKYFTVCQHDDAPSENIEHLDIQVFSAGGNYKNGIPIPLICSKLPFEKNNSPQDIFCSFVGSLTHDVRRKFVDYYKEDKDFLIEAKDWQYIVKKDELQNFINITKKSLFTICARGYGKQSYRFYETIQLGSIPVYLYDSEPYLPFSEEIDYNSFCVLLESNRIHELKTILNNINEEKRFEMLKKGEEVYNNYYTLEKLTEKILKNVK